MEETSLLKRQAQRRAKVAELFRQETEQLHEVAVEEMRRGVPIARVAREIGYSRTAVGKWADKAGLDIRRRAAVEPRTE